MTRAAHVSAVLSRVLKALALRSDSVASILRTPSRDARSRRAGDRRARLLDAVSGVAESPRSTAKARRRPARRRSTRCATSRFPLTQPATIGAGRRRALAVRHSRSASRIRSRTSTGCSRRSTRAEAGVAQGGPRGVGRRLPRDPRTASTRRSFEIANAVMHTTGQAFVMAFQAGGPHAQDRGLEAVAYAWDEMRRIPAQRDCGRSRRARTSRCGWKSISASCRAASALVIGCCTFPTWNGYPGPVREPRHRQRGRRQAASERRSCRSRSPCASRARCSPEAGFDPNVVTLVAHEAGDDVAQTLALRPEVKLIDFTGSTANGRWLEEHARQAQVYTEKAGVNQIDHRLRGRLQGRGAQRRLLARALHRADVHGAAEHLRAEGRHRHRRRPPDRSTRSPRALAEGVRQAARRPRARRRDARRGVRTTACCGGSRPRARSARSCSTRGRIAHPQFPRRDDPHAAHRQARRSATARRTCNEWFGPIAFVIATDVDRRQPGDRARCGRRASEVGEDLPDHLLVVDDEDAGRVSGQHVVR